MRNAAILLAFFGILAVSGCLQRVGTGSTLFEQQYAHNISAVALSSPAMVEECRIGSCWCMVCKNGTNIFGPLNNLIGGYCYMEKNCTNERTADLNNESRNPDFAIRHVMIGQGPSFGDFAIANTHCSDRLSMAVQWLIGTNTTNYTLPDASRTMCFLSKDIIPVYILYSNGTNINNNQAARIGRILGTEGDDLYLGRLSDGPVGPVIVVTEMDFDRSRAAEIAEQVIKIDDECNGLERQQNEIRCFIAVAPKINDFAALDAVMGELRNRGRESSVDLVAYGINSRYVHGCSGTRVKLQALNFSAYALYNHSKPTIIPYILFDPGSVDIDNSCNWTEADVIAAYGSFLPFGLTELQKRGVIGIAPYSFNTTPGGSGISNPLNCTDCGVARTQARMRAWYAGCQSYTNITRSGTSHATPTTQIIFGNESGTICNQNTQFDFFRGLNFAGRDIMQQRQGEVRPPAPLLFRCDACLLTNVTRPVTDMFAGLQPPGGTPQELYCSGFPEIEQWSSVRNIDPFLMRAFILTESGFDPCSAAKVCSKECIQQGCTDRCFPPDFSGNSECYSNAYDEMYDPAGNCSFEIAPNSGQAKPDWRWCAVGLVQSLEPPYTFWPASHSPTGSNGQYFDVFNRSGFHTISLDGARGCNPRFNPFNPSDSVCIGSLKLEGMLRAARQFISSHSTSLNWNTGSGGDADKTNLFAAYIAGNMYAGFWGSKSRSADSLCSSDQTNGECWTQEFERSWRVNATYCSSPEGLEDNERCSGGQPRREPPLRCYGYTDFITYVQECQVPFLPRQVDPGKKKVEAFIYLSNGCANNMCPDGRRFLIEACRPDETGQYNPQLCIGPGQPKVPTSGTLYIPDTVPGAGVPYVPPPEGTGTIGPQPDFNSRGLNRDLGLWSSAG